jgi:VWFA-related protein
MHGKFRGRARLRPAGLRRRQRVPRRQRMRFAFRWMGVLFLCAVTSSLLCAAPGQQSPQAQQAAGPQGQQSSSDTIRVTTRLVQIGVIVRDKNGAVTTLTKDDFRVLEKGKPQTISVFSADAAARNAELAAATTSAKTAAVLPPGLFTNLQLYDAPQPSGSITIVLLDNLNTLYGSSPEDKFEAAPFYIEDLALQNAKNHLLRFLGEMKPQDRVALYGLTTSLRVLCDFTSDRQQLLALVKKYDATSITNREVAEPGRQSAPVLDHEADGFENSKSAALAAMRNGDRAAETAAALQAIAGHVANIPGRKNLVWLTADLPLSGAAMARILAPANIAVYPVDARGLLATAGDPRPAAAGGPGVGMGMGDADQVSGAAGRFDNMPAQSAVPSGIPSMQELAAETGGQAFVNTNDITGAIRKAVEDSEVTYTLGFYVDAKAADGKFHDLKVEVKLKGLMVFYPTGYFAYREEPPKASVNRTNVITAVQSPIESSAIPMAATFERETEGEKHSLRMEGKFEINNVSLAQNGNVREGAVDVDVVQQDATGKVLEHSTDRVPLRFTPEGYAKALQQGIVFQKQIPLYAGSETLRVLVQDPSTGQLGSLVVPLAKIQ